MDPIQCNYADSSNDQAPPKSEDQTLLYIGIGVYGLIFALIAGMIIYGLI